MICHIEQDRVAIVNWTLHKCDGKLKQKGDSEMFDKMLCLIGEQPVPNLLPIKRLKPQEVVLFYTDFTKLRSTYLEPVLVEAGISITHKQINNPYNITEISPIIAEEIAASRSAVLLNLTGGTKPMAFAGLEASRRYKTPFCYLQSHVGNNLCLYEWLDDTLVLRNMYEMHQDLVTIHDYLRIHMGDYCQADFGDTFETSVYETLKPHVSEIKHSVRKGGSLEIDLVIRCGNIVGIAEIKTGKSARHKAGLDQLNAACARELLGHTKKFLIVDREYPPNNKELAMARNINVVELNESTDKNRVADGDKEKLISAIVDNL